MKIGKTILYLILFINITDAIAQQTDDDAELNFWNNWILKEPNNAKNYNHRGLFYLSKKKYQMAMIDLNTSIRLNNKYITPYVWRGECHKRLGEDNLSLQDLTYAIQNKNKLIEEDKDMVYNAYLLRSGLYLYNLYSYDLAITDCGAMLKIKPTDPTAYQYRGTCYYRKSQFHLSVNDLETSLRLEPNNPDALALLRRAVSNRPLRPTAGPYTIEEIEKIVCMDRTQRVAYFKANGFIDHIFNGAGFTHYHEEDERYVGGGEEYELTVDHDKKNEKTLIIETKNEKRKNGVKSSLFASGYRVDVIEEGIQWYVNSDKKTEVGIGKHKPDDLSDYMPGDIFVNFDDVETLRKKKRTNTTNSGK